MVEVDVDSDTDIDIVDSEGQTRGHIRIPHGSVSAGRDSDDWNIQVGGREGER